MADSKEDTAALSNIFAIGDVAETGSPKMGRSGFFQAEVVIQNILAMIHGREVSSVYQSRPDIEGSIKLTLGKVCSHRIDVNFSCGDFEANSSICRVMRSCIWKRRTVMTF